MARLSLSKKAEKDFARLPRNDKERVTKKLEAIATNPLSGKSLSGELRGTYSLRSWPYRIIYLFDKAGSSVIIKKIQHRQGAYKR